MSGRVGSWLTALAQRLAPAGTLTVACTALLLGTLFVGARLLIAADADITRFVVVGTTFSDPDLVDPDVHVFDSHGYDGQFYFRQTLEPLETDTGYVHGIRLDSILRVPRIGYPVIASLAALGRDSWVPAAMVLVNLLAMTAIAWFGAQVARRHGLSPWYGLLLASSTGLVMALSRDLTEVVMVAGLVGGCLAVLAGSWWWATAGWVVAVLAHEQAVIVVAAYGLHRFFGWVRGRERPSIADVPWVVSGVAVVAVQALVARAHGSVPALDSSGANFTVPFEGLLPELTGWLTGDLQKQEILVLPELVGVVVVSVVAVRSRRWLRADDRWIVLALAMSMLFATMLSTSVWVGPAELRQIVIVPTLAWLVILVAGRRPPPQVTALSAALWLAVVALRVVVV